MSFSLRKTNERKLAAGLGLASSISPVMIIVGLFAFLGVFSEKRSWFMAMCIIMFLAWFGIICALNGIEKYPRRVRLWIWGTSALFHIGLAFLAWWFIGGIGIFIAAIELFVTTFSLGGFFVAYIAEEPPKAA